MESVVDPVRHSMIEDMPHRDIRGVMSFGGSTHTTWRLTGFEAGPRRRHLFPDSFYTHVGFRVSASLSSAQEQT
jgi:hypothetical protein